MAQYDGSIRINTQIESGNLTSQMMKIVNSIRKSEAEINRLQARMRELANTNIPTTEYTEIQHQIEETEKKLNSLRERQERFLETGGRQGSTAFQRMNYDAEQLERTLEYARGELQALVESGEAFTPGTDSEEYARAAERVRELEGNIAASRQRLVELNARQRPVTESFDRMRNSAQRTFSSIRSGSDNVSKSLKTGFKTILKYGLGIRSLYALINKFRTAVKEGFSNLAQFSAPVNENISMLMSSLTQLKNSLATAFAPILDIVAPALTSLINMLSQAATYVGMLIAALTGASTFTKAISVQEDYAASLNKTAGAAKKAAGALASFDTLEVLNKKDSGGGGGAGGISPSEMFEEVQIDTRLIKWLDDIKEKMKPIIDYLGDLKDLFMEGFWDGLGDWEYRWDSIKDSIASIKKSLIDIFTDPSVLAAAERYTQSVAYLIGSIVGSLASIGLTIAANILGGIEKYLEENKDRIKKYLTSMFDIGAEINYLLSDFFQSFAYVFEAFASENGQQLTANLIGMFVDGFMGASELVGKFARDILNIFIQPFVDNKEGFRTALEGFLGVLADVAGTIKQGIDDTFDKLNEVYDDHFKPFFDSIAQGLSEIVGHFLEFWNGTVQPILENWASRFDELWKGHIQPFINNFIDLLGNLADMLKALWENILVPLIHWFIDNFGPEIAAVINGAGEIFMTFLGIVIDIASGIIDGIRNIVDFLTNVFQGNWEAAWNNIINFIIGPVAQNMREAGKNIIDGIKNGIMGAWESLKETMSAVAKSVKERFCFLLGINSPSTVFSEIGGYLIQGLANGISSAIDLVTSIISGLVDNILGMFSFDKWAEAGQGMIDSIVSVIGAFRETWNTSFDDWMISNQELYFGYNIWYEQFLNILTAYTDMFAEFSAQWQADMDAWWNTMVMPFFDLAQWTLFGTQMKNGIMTGLKSVVNEIGGLLNKIIGMFNSAFKELEESMNNLISDYNKSAKELGTSTLSKVKYSPMASIKVPALADGAVIRGGNPFLAILGDQRYGQTNIEAPLSTIKQAVREEIADMGYGSSGSGSVPVNINLNYNGETFARLSIPDILAELNRQGYDITALMGNG